MSSYHVVNYVVAWRFVVTSSSSGNRPSKAAGLWRVTTGQSEDTDINGDLTNEKLTKSNSRHNQTAERPNPVSLGVSIVVLFLLLALGAPFL